MLVIYSPDHLRHDPKFELYDGTKTAYPELPDRIEVIAAALRTIPAAQFVRPHNYSDDELFGLQLPAYVEYVRHQCEAAQNSSMMGQQSDSDRYPSNFIHDTYAPLTAGTYQAARSALATALTGADKLLQTGQLVYSLCRPPGHHAGDAYMGGYCYFNNAAAAAQRLTQHGRVAILDIDYHHGNGTQQLFYDRADVLYVSVHADPDEQYPYTHGRKSETGRGSGMGLNKNIVIQKNCGWKAYQKAFNEALKTVKEFVPDYLVVSLGFDGYKDDPIAGFGLDLPHYSQIAHDIAKLNLPTLLIQEGGYCVEALGTLAKNFCESAS